MWLSGLFSLALLGCSDDTVAPAPEMRAGDIGMLGDRPAGEGLLADRGPGEAQGTTLSATLSGAQEVPPVSTSATGSASATLNAAQTEIST
ncbi:MAG: CHRD domain-containing protein, partial [Anaerolineae bacterium]|nr:CHRD domain-containing protein [Anaerolineae bacterium]